MARRRHAALLSREGAIVIGGDYRALGIVRSLGRRNIPVWVLTNEHRLATVSRYAERYLPWPQPEQEQVSYLLHLSECHGLNGWALFPSDDEAAASLARRHSTLAARFRLTTPSWDTLRWAYDKRCTYQVAASLGIDQPRTFFPRNRDEAAALDCSFPVILKPAYKEHINAFTLAKAWRADDRASLISAYDKARRLVDPRIIMVQAFIPGGGEEQFSYAALCVNGRAQASITARRMRQYPIDFGRASSFVRSVDIPHVDEPARRLLKAIGLTGLAEVEFKRDPRTGSYQLLDINARVWGWHTLGAKAGVDFPYLLWRLVHGETLPEVRGRSGVSWVRMLTDVQATAAEFRRGRLSWTDYVRSLRGPLEFAIFALDDPAPALLDIPFLAWLALKRIHGNKSRRNPKTHGIESAEREQSQHLRDVS
jgi:D-aspartate ligase